MKHTREEHLAMAAALRAAIPYLWDGVVENICHQKFICHDVQLTNKTQWTTVNAWIGVQLKGFGVLGSWLKGKGYEPYEDTPKLQTTRLAWMHHMIEVLEKE